MSEIKSYRDLKIWQNGIDLSVNVYSLTKDFPETEKFGLTSQMRRCSSSISANIAEGYGRKSSKSYCQFLKISRGSLYELDTHLELSERLGLITKIELFKIIKQQIIEEGKMINAFINKIELN